MSCKKSWTSAALRSENFLHLQQSENVSEALASQKYSDETHPSKLHVCMCIATIRIKIHTRKVSARSYNHISRFLHPRKLFLKTTPQPSAEQMYATRVGERYSNFECGRNVLFEIRCMVTKMPAENYFTHTHTDRSYDQKKTSGNHSFP